MNLTIKKLNTEIDAPKHRLGKLGLHDVYIVQDKNFKRILEIRFYKRMSGRVTACLWVMTKKFPNYRYSIGHKNSYEVNDCLKRIINDICGTDIDYINHTSIESYVRELTKAFMCEEDGSIENILSTNP